MVRDISYSFDEQLILDNIDEKLVSMDLDTLLQIQAELKRNNEDTELIDKAIKKKKEFMESEEKKNKLTFGQFLFGVYAGIKTSPKRKNKQEDDLKKDGYESWNFEEEELEEDDYHYDDLD